MPDLGRKQWCLAGYVGQFLQALRLCTMLIPAGQIVTVFSDFHWKFSTLFSYMAFKRVTLFYETGKSLFTKCHTVLKLVFTSGFLTA